MTIFEASVKLYGWFSEHDSFCLETDENKLLEGARRKKCEKNEEQAAITCALKDLEGLNMISSASIGEGTEVWVLKKDFKTMEQTVNLNPDTCQSIAQIVNGFCDVLNLHNEEDRVNPLEVKEKDIKNLVFVSAHLMDKSEPEQE